MEELIAAYSVVGIDDEMASISADLRAACKTIGRSPGLNDLWIAATSVRLSCPVAVLDGDFEHIPEYQSRRGVRRSSRDYLT